MNKKIYCKNCKYWKYKDLLNRTCCTISAYEKKFVMDKITGVMEIKEVETRPEIKETHSENRHTILNANNDCKYYERVWYKFFEPKQNKKENDLKGALSEPEYKNLEGALSK